MISNGVLNFRASLILVLLLMPLMKPVLAQNSTSNIETEQTNSTANSNDLFYLCKRDKNIRWLRAYKLENGKCKALYSKEGYLQVISSATYFSSCEGVLLSVKKNLEEGNFKCSLQSKVSVIELQTEQ